jgi:hypothetical protein
MSAPFESRTGVDVPDYFSATGLGSLGPRHQGSPFQRIPFPPGFEPDTMIGAHQQYIDEMVRRCGHSPVGFQMY